jgi:hypothetical protein
MHIVYVLTIYRCYICKIKTFYGYAIMIQVLYIVLRKILFNSELFPFWRWWTFWPWVFFPLTVLGSFLEGSSVQGAVGSILAEFSESKKTSGDRTATLLYHSLLFPFWGEIAASGKGRGNPSFPPGMSLISA